MLIVFIDNPLLQFKLFKTMHAKNEKKQSPQTNVKLIYKIKKHIRREILTDEGGNNYKAIRITSKKNKSLNKNKF